MLKYLFAAADDVAFFSQECHRKNIPQLFSSFFLDRTVLP